MYCMCQAPVPSASDLQRCLLFHYVPLLVLLCALHRMERAFYNDPWVNDTGTLLQCPRCPARPHTRCMESYSDTSSSSSDDSEVASNSLTQSQQLRLLAVQAAFQAKGIHAFASIKGDWASTAVRLFVKCLPGAQLPEIRNPKAFIVKWEAQFTERGTIHDKPRSGRPHKLPEAAVAAALLFIKQRQDQKKPICTQHEANKSPLFQAICRTYSVQYKTLWRRMHAYDSTLRHSVIMEFRRVLTQANKDARVDQCKRWLKQGIVRKVAGGSEATIDGETIPLPPPHEHTNVQPYTGNWLTDWALNIIWIDAKTVSISPHSRKVWAVGSDIKSFTIEDCRLNYTSTWVIKYYSAVTARFGGLLLATVSGTHGAGYTPAKEYKVSA